MEGKMMRTFLTAAAVLGAALTAGGAPQDAISKIDKNMEVGRRAASYSVR